LRGDLGAGEHGQQHRAKTAMMPMTTSSSMSVNPWRLDFIGFAIHFNAIKTVRIGRRVNDVDSGRGVGCEIGQRLPRGVGQIGFVLDDVIPVWLVKPRQEKSAAGFAPRC